MSGIDYTVNESKVSVLPAKTLRQNAGEEKSRLLQEVKQELIVLRKSRNITQKEIGEMTGMSAANMTRIERDDYDPSLEIMLRYANALGKTLDIRIVDLKDGRESSSSGEKTEHSDNRIRLDDQEKRLIAYYRGLSGGGKKMVCRIARDLGNLDGQERSDDQR